MARDYSNAGLPAPQPNPASLSAQTGAYSSSLLIEELTALPGQQPRSVTLQGPGLPFQGADWPVEMMAPTKWYPGNGDEATQQFLGPRDVPSTWRGEWNRTRMGKAPSIAVGADGNSIVVVDPLTLATSLEDIFRAGSRLRVTWSQTSDNPSSRGKIVREGRCTSFKPTYVRMQDVSWEATFTWVSRGARRQTVTSVRDGALDAAAAKMSLAMADLASQLAAAPFIASNGSILNSATPFTLGQLEALANLPTTYVTALGRSFLQIQNQLQQVANIASTLADQPAQIVGAALNTARNAIAVANQFVDQMGQVPLELMSTKSTVHDLMRGFRYFGQSSTSAYEAALASQAMIAQMQTKAPTPSGAGAINPQSAQAQAGDMLAVYVAKDGDTPARISVRFYGTMDHYVDILQANRLPWNQPSFNKGQILWIPRLKTQQRTA